MTAKTDNHNLFSKADISEMMGITTQGFANRISRDADFPQPTYSNRNGTVVLYTKEDVAAIHAHMTRADRERIERLNKAMAGLGVEPIKEAPAEEPKKTTTRGKGGKAQPQAAQPADAPLEGQTEIPTGEEAMSE
jgi:hypothetical protein